MIYLILSVLFIAAAFLVWHRINNQHTSSGDFSKLKSPLVIFDFDGTICPSFDLFIDELNTLSDSYGHRKIEKGEKTNLRDLSAKEVIKTLRISTLKLPFLMSKLKTNVQSRILNLEPVTGMIEVLQELKARGISMGILTSNSEANVHAWLKVYNLDIFDFVFTGNNLFGKDRHLKFISNNLSEVYYVGDEVRDMEAAKQAHVKSVAVTWGYNSQECLATASPDYLCHQAIELASIIKVQK